MGTQNDVEEVEMENDSGRDKEDHENQTMGQSGHSSPDSDVKLSPENADISSSNNGTFSCKVCHRTFLHRYTLFLHMRVHSGHRPFVCKTCNMAFVWKSLLDRHEAVHTGNKPFVCRHCNKGFCQRTSLVHHERTHTGEKPFVCTVCDKKFAQKGHLKEHSKIHSGDRPYPCHFCKKGFSSRGNLNQHKKIHTGERPYVCGICYRSFTQKVHLKDHLRRHKGEGQFVCDICYTGFVMRENLHEHAKSHTEQTAVHFCDTCGRHYSQEVFLKQHKRCRPPAALAESVPEELSPNQSNGSFTVSRFNTKRISLDSIDSSHSGFDHAPSRQAAFLIQGRSSSPLAFTDQTYTRTNSYYGSMPTDDHLPLDLSCKSAPVFARRRSLPTEDRYIDLSRAGVSSVSPVTRTHYVDRPVQSSAPFVVSNRAVFPHLQEDSNGGQYIHEAGRSPQQLNHPVDASKSFQQQNQMTIIPTHQDVYQKISPNQPYPHETVPYPNGRPAYPPRPFSGEQPIFRVQVPGMHVGTNNAQLSPHVGSPRSYPKSPYERRNSSGGLRSLAPRMANDSTYPVHVRIPSPLQQFVPSYCHNGVSPGAGKEPLLKPKELTFPNSHIPSNLTNSVSPGNRLYSAAAQPYPPYVGHRTSSPQDDFPVAIGSVVSTSTPKIKENNHNWKRSVCIQTSPSGSDGKTEQSPDLAHRNRIFILETELKCMQESMERHEQECMDKISDLRRGVVQLMGMLDPEMVVDLLQASGEEIDLKLKTLVLSLKQMN